MKTILLVLATVLLSLPYSAQNNDDPSAEQMAEWSRIAHEEGQKTVAVSTIKNFYRNKIILYVVFGVIAAIGLAIINSNKKNKINTGGNSNSSSNRESLKSNDYIDPEINILQQKIISFNLELDNLRNEGNLLNRSINQNLINENSYDSKMNELDSAFFSIENKKTKYENRFNAILNISDTLRDLNELCDKNLISIYQKETKRNELINQEIKSMLKADL